MAYYWYRVFVYIADYANSIPQFRMLSTEDQVYRKTSNRAPCKRKNSLKNRV